jgi:site-specific recombinase XerC
MPETALAVPSNLSHNVPAAIAAAKTSLTGLATLYLVAEVTGQSRATLDAKRRDFHRFLAFHALYGHNRPEEWFVSMAKAFIKHLRGQRFAQAALVRIYATVWHFARWLDRKFPGLCPLGCPMDGVKPPVMH